MTGRHLHFQKHQYFPLSVGQGHYAWQNDDPLGLIITCAANTHQQPGSYVAIILFITHCANITYYTICCYLYDLGMWHYSDNVNDLGTGLRLLIRLLCLRDLATALVGDLRKLNDLWRNCLGSCWPECYIVGLFLISEEHRLDGNY